MTPDRLYSMDESGFTQKQKSEKVVALRRLGNVWMKSENANFNMTYVVAVSKTGSMAPPLLIIPGQILNQDFLYGCDIPGFVVTCVPKCFMNASLSVKFLEDFDFVCS